MVTINVEIKNLNEIRMAFLRAPQKMARNLQTAIDRSTAKIQREAKNIIRKGRGYSKRPFASGTLFRSIFTERKPLQGRVFTDLNYAIYPHEGLSTSRRYGARPFMRDAAKDSDQFIQNEFKEAVKRSLP